MLPVNGYEMQTHLFECGRGEVATLNGDVAQQPLLIRFL